MLRVAGMPDLHPGRGYPVGAAFFSVGRFYPALIGNDIGCGMALWQTDLSAAKAKPAKLARQLGSIDTPLDAGWQARIDEILPNHPFQTALGTIGGGNHFAELQTVDTVYHAAMSNGSAITAWPKAAPMRQIIWRNTNPPSTLPAPTAY